MSDFDDGDSRQVFSAVWLVVKSLFWLGSIASAVFAAYFVFINWGDVQGAPQQAAVAAYGLVVAVVPYIIARGVSELGQ